MISVIIPTYNPNLERLEQTLLGLKAQTLDFSRWELIIIDNNSTVKFDEKIDLSWHPNAKIVFEGQQGLTFARLKGIATAQNNSIVMVDDDNILFETYLENVISIFDNYPKLGVIGGKSIPIFEKTPPDFVNDFYGLLALRDLGDEIRIQSFENNYPKYAPIGAGMSFKKTAIQTYIKKINTKVTILSDRTGNSLSSSGDNDMVMEILKDNWQIGYFPELQLYHIIPESRTTKSYLARLNYSIQKSWVQFLLQHGLSPWKQIHRYSVLPRIVKAWFFYKAWKDEIGFMKWKGAIGMYEGLAK